MGVAMEAGERENEPRQARRANLSLLALRKILQVVEEVLNIVLLPGGEKPPNALIVLRTRAIGHDVSGLTAVVARARCGCSSTSACTIYLHQNHII